MLRALPDRSLDQVLARVSRSFYLSLAVLPREIRPQLSIAYLVARAADTIADTRLVDARRRLELLGRLRAALSDASGRIALSDDVRVALGTGGGVEAERVLLERFGECLAALDGAEAGDRERTREVLVTLITGMERDLERFPEAEDGPRRIVALGTEEELDEYCWFAAGCVGAYWTRMTAAHVPAVERLGRPDLVARGVRLGKALQLVNVIRDAAADLANGRCYWPTALLEPVGLEPEDLRDPARRRSARPVVERLRQLALHHIDAAFPYVMAIPATEPRLRLAALWPLWIGLATLGRLRDAPDPLDPAAPAKISRRDVYAVLAESAAVVGLDGLLARRHAARRRSAD